MELQITLVIVAIVLLVLIFLILIYILNKTISNTKRFTQKLYEQNEELALLITNKFDNICEMECLKNINHHERDNKEFVIIKEEVKKVDDTADKAEKERIAKEKEELAKEKERIAKEKEEFEKNQKKLKEFNELLDEESVKIEIITIKGIGPKTKAYFNKKGIYILGDLVEQALHKDDLHTLISGIPGLKSEKYIDKSNKFNNFIEQAKKRIEEYKNQLEIEKARDELK